MIQFTVSGTPRPKGSLRHIGKGRMIEQTDVKQWMGTVRARAMQIAREPMQGPCAALLMFTFERPKSAQNRLYPSVRSTGDIDKLTRAIMDALQPVIHKKTKTVQWPGAIDDDAQVVRLLVAEDYGPNPGVDVLVWELGIDDHTPPVQEAIGRFVSHWLPDREVLEGGPREVPTVPQTLI